MPKVRLLVPANYKDEPHAAGAELDVDVETFLLWRMRGLASSLDDEEAQAKAAEEGGNYSAYTGRAETGQSTAKPAKAAKADEKT